MQWNLLQTFFLIVSQVRLIQWVNVLKQVSLETLCHNSALTLTLTFPYCNVVPCTFFIKLCIVTIIPHFVSCFSDSDRFFKLRRSCYKHNWSMNSQFFWEPLRKDWLYVAVCCCFHPCSGWAVHLDCLSTVWHISGWLRRRVRQFLWGMFKVAFAVFVISSCSWIESSLHCAFLMTLIISIIVCHRRGYLRLKMLIVRNSEIHITLQCVRRVVSAFCTCFEVKSNSCKL
jgi:hypothetical protein